MNVELLKLSFNAIVKKIFISILTFAIKLIIYPIKLLSFLRVFTHWLGLNLDYRPWPSADLIVSKAKLIQMYCLGILDPQNTNITVNECPMGLDCKICQASKESVDQHDTDSGGNKDESKEIAEMIMSDFTGDDLMWDVPLLAKKAKYFAECLEKKDAKNIAAARKALEEHPVYFSRPQTRREYEQIAEECNFQSSGDVTISTVVVDPPNKLKSKKRVVFRDDGNPKRASEKEIQVNLLKTCVSLLEVVSDLNCKIDEFVQITVTNLKNELDGAKKLLGDVEADRNESKLKLAILEKLIKEEQEFLDDISGESGFDENEHNLEDI